MGLTCFKRLIACNMAGFPLRLASEVLKMSSRLMRFLVGKTFLTFGVLWLTSVTASYAEVVALHGTGFDSSGNPLQNGGVDGSWTVTNGAASGNAFAITWGNSDFWWAYAPNTNAAVFSGSGWISNTASSAYNGPAPYTFAMTFDLSRWELNTISIAGQWSIADGGTLNFNGHQIDSMADPGCCGPFGPWDDMHPFSVPLSDLVSGVNTVTMTVTSADGYFEAARFEGSINGTPLSNVPEPNAILLFITMVGGVAGAARLRRFV
jgi:hypothetical protein